MRFITENELREQFKINPIQIYETAPDVKLTPGARQFLIDRGIDLYHGAESKSSRANYGTKNHSDSCSCNCPSIEALKAFVLESALEMSQWDPQSAGKLRELYGWISQVLAGDSCCKSVSPICEQCNGMNPDNYDDLLPDCFPIDETFLLQTKCKTIIRLHRIRCEMRKLETAAAMNQAINRMSQLICATLGGGKCKTK